MARSKKSVSWIALSGTPTVTPALITYHPVKVEEGPSAGQNMACLLRSDRYFQNGRVTFELNRGSADSLCQLILGHGTGQDLFVGFSGGPDQYLMATYRANKWETIVSSGWKVPPRVGEWVKVTVAVSGSSVEAYVDEVKVLSTLYPVEKSQLALFLLGPAEIRVRSFEVFEQRPEVFVVMQFTEEFNALFQEVIRPTCEAFGYTCVRGDDIYNNGLIIDDITASIRQAAVVIADVTPNNPNVFYEVGYSHGIGKPTILLADKERENRPFDISGFRTVIYENTIGGKSQVEDRLRKHLANLRG